MSDTPELVDINKLREKRRQQHIRAWQIRNKDKVDAYVHKSRCKRQGITIEDYAFMLVMQNSACDICKETFLKPMSAHIDHNHETGEVRSLLCRSCNVGIGLFRENVKYLYAAIEYIRNDIL